MEKISIDSLNSKIKSYQNEAKSDIDNLSELNYVFNGTKLSLADAKVGMVQFLNKNVDELFKTNANLQKMKQLFETNALKFNTKIEFKGLLNNNSSFRENVLKFIKTQ